MWTTRYIEKQKCKQSNCISMLSSFFTSVCCMSPFLTSKRIEISYNSNIKQYSDTPIYFTFEEAEKLFYNKRRKEFSITCRAEREKK